MLLISSHTKDYFLDRFTDTGIWSEWIIRKGYEENSEYLLNDAMEHIKKAFQSEIIPYARDSKDKDLLHTLIRMEGRYLGVSYYQLDDTTRKIINIRIWRRK